MALMLAEIYDALIEAGSSEAKARAAAEAIAAYDNRLLVMEGKLDKLQYSLDRAVVESRVVRGIAVTILLGVLWRVW